MLRWGLTCIAVGSLLNIIGFEIISWLAIIPGILFFILGIFNRDI